MSRWYIIKGLGPAFDGLIVKADHAVQSWRIVEKIINRNIIFGDREFSVIIPESGVMIREKFLKQIDEPMFREFAKTNHGVHLFQKVAKRVTESSQRGHSSTIVFK
jgi:hypothetical protein